MALSPADVRRLEVANARARTAVRQRLEQYAKASWLGLGSWRDADIARWVSLISPRVTAGQVAIANLTDQYLARILAADPVGVIDVRNLRGGPTAAEVYARPAVTMRTKLSEGSTMTAALQAGALRAVDLVTTDLQLAMTHQSQVSMSRHGVQFFQRVLVGPADCALCMIASTQHYRTGNLMPIHPGCNCDVRPLPNDTARFTAMDGSDRVIDPDLLAKTHNMVADLLGDADSSGRSPDYRKLLAVREHGEIGPVLTFKHQQFTGPSAI